MSAAVSHILPPSGGASAKPGRGATRPRIAKAGPLHRFAVPLPQGGRRFPL